MARHADVPCWVCVGDVGDDRGHYESPPADLYWIKGNNEDFAFVAAQIAGERRVPRLHYIPNAIAVAVGSIRVAGLGGTFAPTWYETPAAGLPHPDAPHSKVRDDKRRHFVREEVEACKQLHDVDLFLTHEAPKPFFVGFPGGGARRGMDAGKLPINEILRAMQPRLHLFGHHHRFVEQEREGVRSVCLDPSSRSYLLIDADTLEYQRLET